MGTFDDGRVNIDVIAVVAEYGKDSDASNYAVNIASFPPNDAIERLKTL